MDVFKMLGIRLQTAEIDGERWCEVVLTIPKFFSISTVI